MKKPRPRFVVLCSDSSYHASFPRRAGALFHVGVLDAAGQTLGPASCSPHRVVRYEATEPKPRKRRKVK